MTNHVVVRIIHVYEERTGLVSKKSKRDRDEFSPEGESHL